MNANVSINGGTEGKSAMAHEPLPNGRRLMAIPGVFYGGGCSYMACRGLMMSGISDVLLITHGPVGCSYYSGIDPYMGYPGEVPSFAGRVFTTDMDETDIIFGGEQKLHDAIKEAVNTYHPKAIAICATCPVGLIGDDIDQVARDCSEEFGVDVLPLSCEGFRAEPGWLLAGRQMFENWVGKDTREVPEGRFPIHYMSESYKQSPIHYTTGSGSRFGRQDRVHDLLSGLGYDVVCSLMGSTRYEDIVRSQDARLIVLDSGKAIDAVPHMYQEKYGTGFMRICMTGLGNIERSLMSMAEFFGDEGLIARTREALSMEFERIAPALEAERAKFSGLTVAVFEDIFRSNDFSTLSIELDMNVVMVGPDYSLERLSDDGFSVHLPSCLVERVEKALDQTATGNCVIDLIRNGETVDHVPGCENSHGSREGQTWVHIVASRSEVSELLQAISPDMCFAGIQERFGALDCPMKNERFLSDERGCNYIGFDGFERYARDLDMARHYTERLSDIAPWDDCDKAIVDGRRHQLHQLDGVQLKPEGGEDL